MEPWITPTIFEEVNVGELKNKIVDEYTYAQYVDREFATKRLDRFNTIDIVFHCIFIRDNNILYD